MVKVGVVGLGAWGWNVARNFADLKDCQLVTCCDADPKRLAAAKRAWPSVNTANSFDEMLQESIEAVIISSPAVTHYELAKKDAPCRPRCVHRKAIHTQRAARRRTLRTF